MGLDVMCEYCKIEPVPLERDKYCSDDCRKKANGMEFARRKREEEKEAYDHIKQFSPPKKIVECLGCGKKFMGSKSNRFCPSCTYKNENKGREAYSSGRRDDD